MSQSKYIINPIDLKNIGNILKESNLIDVLWEPNNNSIVSLDLYSATEIMKNGGSNPGIPKITMDLIKNCYEEIQKYGYDIIQLSCYFVLMYPRPCFSDIAYSNMNNIRKYCVTGEI